MASKLQTDLDRLYAILASLERGSPQWRLLRECTGRLTWAQRGVYFFREPGELRSSDPHASRIVRVGTHAVSAGSGSTLWARLRAHRGHVDGSGNHRASIFRLHVGAALLAAEGTQLLTWGAGPSASREVRINERAQEQLVSDYLGAMSVLWVEVPGEPGPNSDRALIEKNAIALLSNRFTPLDPPSQRWLGRHSPHEEIVRSGLWNLNYADQPYDPLFLDVLEAHVLRTRVV